MEHHHYPGYRRDPQRKGAEGANPVTSGMKLSGKRTVTRSHPGKLQASGPDTDGDKSRAFPGIISQVNRQEERGYRCSSFLLFVFEKEKKTRRIFFPFPGMLVKKDSVGNKNRLPNRRTRRLAWHSMPRELGY
jgi:hypothetical protein